MSGSEDILTITSRAILEFARHLDVIAVAYSALSYINRALSWAKRRNTL